MCYDITSPDVATYFVDDMAMRIDDLWDNGDPYYEFAVDNIRAELSQLCPAEALRVETAILERYGRDAASYATNIAIWRRHGFPRRTGSTCPCFGKPRPYDPDNEPF